MNVLFLVKNAVNLEQVPHQLYICMVMHCVVPENIHTPPTEGNYLETPLPPGFSVLGGIIQLPNPPGISLDVALKPPPHPTQKFQFDRTII